MEMRNNKSLIGLEIELRFDKTDKTDNNRSINC